MYKYTRIPCVVVGIRNYEYRTLLGYPYTILLEPNTFTSWQYNLSFSSSSSVASCIILYFFDLLRTFLILIFLLFDSRNACTTQKRQSDIPVRINDMTMKTRTLSSTQSLDWSRSRVVTDRSCELETVEDNKLNSKQFKKFRVWKKVVPLIIFTHYSVLNLEYNHIKDFSRLLWLFHAE